MATSTQQRTDYRRALPTYTQAAAMIEIDPTGIGRAVQRLGIAPVEWGGREKRLKVVDLLRIAQGARRATVDEVAGSLMTYVEQQHPEFTDTIAAQIEAYFNSVHPATPPVDGFLQEIRSALPAKHANTVERIYRRYIDNS